jgi:hypothetical protein
MTVTIGGTLIVEQSFISPLIYKIIEQKKPPYSRVPTIMQ